MKVYIQTTTSSGACYEYRNRIPFSSLVENGIDTLVHENKFSISKCDLANLIVFSRTYSKQHSAAMKYTIAAGRAPIYEVDDLLTMVPSWNPFSYAIEPHLDTLVAQLRMAKTLVVSTNSLKEMFNLYNENIRVIPNAYMDGPIPEVMLDTPTYLIHPGTKVSEEFVVNYLRDKTVVCWGGSATHSKDLELIKDPLVQVASENKDVVFVFIGYCVDSILKLLPTNQVLRVGNTPFRNYLPLLKHLNCNIGLAPLVDHSFNLCKSNIKVVEYIRAGVVPLASDILPYQELPSSLLCSSEDEWYSKLTSLIQNRNTTSFYQNSFKFVEDYSISKVKNLWLEIFKGYR